MEWITELLRSHPELAIYLTLGSGFLIGKIQVRGFSLGIVTSVLLAGVIVGQLQIPVTGALKQTAFLLFLFAIGYKVGPQFFAGLRKEGLPQVYFSILMCVFILFSTWIISIVMSYNAGEAAGLLSGSQTISAVIGVAGDTIRNLGISVDEQKKWTDIIPVAYAITYIFGTAGSAWILARLGPKMLGGTEKVKLACRELEERMGHDESEKPGIIDAKREVEFRCYRIENDWFKNGRSVRDVEHFFERQGKRLFVERLRKKKNIIDDVSQKEMLYCGDEIVLSGRHEYTIGEEKWIGKEVNDDALQEFPVMILKSTVAGHSHKLAERMAKRHIPMTMEDWANRIDIILEAGGDTVLDNAGQISAEFAKQFAESEFEKYRIIQDRLFESDFDRFNQNLLEFPDDIQ